MSRASDGGSAREMAKVEEVNCETIPGSPVEPGERAFSGACGCCLYTVVLAAVIFFQVYWGIHGRTERILNGYDYQGRTCGIDVPEPNMFFCESSEVDGSLDVRHPVCRAKCPEDRSTQGECYTPSRTAAALGLSYHNDYKTYRVPGGFCIPADKHFLAESRSQILGSDTFWIMFLADLFNAVWVLSVAIAVAVGFSYMYIIVMPCFAHLVVCSCVLVTMIAFFAMGIYIIVLWFTGDVDGNPFTENEVIEQVAGWILIVCGILTCFLCFRLNRAMDKACDGLEAAGRVLLHMPFLMVSPLLATILNFGVFVDLFYIIVTVFSASEMKKDADGVATFHVDWYQWIALVVGMIWALWTLKAIQFATIFVNVWATLLYYFTTTQFWAWAFSAWVFVRYHLGDAFEFGLGELIYGWIVHVQSIITAVVPLPCEIRHWAFQSCAWNNLGIRMRKLTPYTPHVSYDPRVLELVGVCWVFEALGLVAIPIATTALMWFLMRSVDAFKDPNDDLYVNDASQMAVFVYIVSLITAIPFMGIFGVTWNTLLFSFSRAVEQATDAQATSDPYATVGSFFTGSKNYRLLTTSKTPYTVTPTILREPFESSGIAVPRELPYEQ